MVHEVAGTVPNVYIWQVLSGMRECCVADVSDVDVWEKSDGRKGWSVNKISGKKTAILTVDLGEQKGVVLTLMFPVEMDNERMANIYQMMEEDARQLIEKVWDGCCQL